MIALLEGPCSSVSSTYSVLRRSHIASASGLRMKQSEHPAASPLPEKTMKGLNMLVENIVAFAKNWWSRYFDFDALSGQRKT